MINKLFKHWQFLLVTPLFLGALETAFIKFNGISVFSSEAGFAYFILFILGFALSCIALFCGELFKLIYAAVLITLIVFTQSNGEFHLFEVHSLYFILPLTALFYLIRTYVDKLCLILFFVLFSGSFFTSQMPIITQVEYPQSIPENLQLPPYIEIVLDEHIGVKGLSSLDKGNFSKRFAQKYINRGFRVYEKAYSRDFETTSSFANFLNYKPVKNLQEYVQMAYVPFHMIQNEHFKQLSKKGYLLNVLQSTYLDLCKQQEGIHIKQCISYNYTGKLTHLKGQLLGKVLYIITNSLPFIFQEEYGMEWRDALMQFFNISFYSKEVRSFPAIATYEAFPELLQQLRTVKKGHAYFVHLLIPHGPYVFGERCRYIKKQENIVEQYLLQVQCTQFMMEQLLTTLERSPEGKNSIIVIHGDHGSKLLVPTTANQKSFTAENIMQAYNTLFLVKAPFITAGYDKQPFPLDYLLHAIVSDQSNLAYEEKMQFIHLRRYPYQFQFDFGNMPVSQIYGAKDRMLLPTEKNA
jgi:hypothetical protein